MRAFAPLWIPAFAGITVWNAGITLLKFALGFYWMRLDMKTILTAAAIIIIAAACGASADAPMSGGDAGAALEPIRGPVSEDGLQAIFATPDLGVGRHRVAFALTSRTGLIDAPSATVQSFYAPPEGEE